MTNYTNICRSIETQMALYPEKIFINFNGKNYSYGNFNVKSNQTANMLKHQGVIPGDIVGILVENIDEFIVSVLASIKLNTTYLPLSNTYPPKYIGNIIDCSKTKHIITNNMHLVRNDSVNNILYENSCNYSIQNGQEDITFSNPVSVFFEESSSGIQEGMVFSLQYILNWLEFNINLLKFRFDNILFIYDTRTLLNFPVWLGSLVTGGRIFFRNINTDYSELQDLINTNNISSMICPLSFINNICERKGYKSILSTEIKNIMSFGEETFDANDFKNYIKGNSIKWYNYFGFPQVFMVTTLRKDVKDSRFVHVGKFNTNTTPFVLDNSKQLVPDGLFGDLYVTGNCTIDSFQNELVNYERFIQIDDFSTQKLFKTGYKACWLPDGMLSLDNSECNIIKVNGINVSILGIEKALYSNASIKDCAVISRKRDDGSLYLTAFLVMNDSSDLEEIERKISDLLPKDILPLAFVKVPYIPRNYDGTVNFFNLNKCRLIDSIQVKELEGSIKSESGIENASVIVKRNFEKVLPYHTNDVFPDKIIGLQHNNEDTSKASEEKQVSKEINNSSLPLALADGGILKREDGYPRVLSDILETAVKKNGDKQVSFIGSDKSTSMITYSQILNKSERILCGLRINGIKSGDKAILHFDKTEDYFCAFWACTLGGVIPVPIGVPKVYSIDSSEIKAIRNIWDTLECPAILTSANSKVQLNDIYKDFELICIEDLIRNERDNCWYKSKPEDIAVILFTSGSTGKPKGVTQSHKNILARQKSTIIFHNLTEKEISINWLPVEHVVGLFMFHIKEVYLGCTQIHVSTELILSDPLIWIDLISQYRVTMAWAPNFAYSLVSDAIEKQGTRNWDLISLKLISNCGESVNGDTTKKFIKLLEPFNLGKKVMKPEWGMSETCSCVMGAVDFDSSPYSCIHTIDKKSMGSTLKYGSSETDNVTFVDLGIPYPGTLFRIVDTNNTILRERVIGRLQVKGETVTPGYYNNPEINNEVFVGDEWFDTGDLGFIYNGRITLTGRAKDVVIINGINYNNNEIEAIVEELDNVSISYTVACAVKDKKGTEKLVIFFNTGLTNFEDIIKLVNDIRNAIIIQMGITPEYIIPADKNEIPKTSIGKLQRTKLVKEFEEGCFNDRIKSIEIGLGNKNTIPAWFYKREWRPKAVSPNMMLRQSSHCLIIENNTGYGESFASRLSREGCNCITIKSAEYFKKIDSHKYEIKTTEYENYIRLLDGLSYDGDIDVFFVNKCTQQDIVDANIEEVRRYLDSGIYSILSLIKALNTRYAASDKVVRIFAISENSQWIEDDINTSFENVGLGGFLKSAALELKWLEYCYIDLDTSINDYNIETIIREWKGIRIDPEVAIRNGKRFIPVLSKMNLKTHMMQDFSLKEARVYLVTGGLGGIGVQLCKWLIQKFNTKLVIVGRTHLPKRSEWEDVLKQGGSIAKRINNYIEIESTKANFIYEACDICDETAMKNVLQKAQSRWGESVSGVFHLAGVGSLEEHWRDIGSHTIINESIESFENKMNAKVYGTILLHKLLRETPDTIFVMFSSVIGFLGLSTLSAYASANSFLDSFCYYMRTRGYSNTYCINWSTWHNTGMSENISPIMTKLNGFEIIYPKQGIDSLFALLCCKPDNYYVGIDATSESLQHFIENNSLGKQVLSIFYSQKTGACVSDEEIKVRVLAFPPIHDNSENFLLRLNKLDSLPSKDGKVDYKQLYKIDIDLSKGFTDFDVPETEVEKKLSNIWNGIFEVDCFGANDSFFDIGGNSIKATSLIARIHKEMDVKLKLADVFNYSTIRKMSLLISKSNEVKYIPIEQADENKEYYPLSPIQEGIYIASTFNKEGVAYNMTSVNMLQGFIDKERLEECFKTLIYRHESLRTSFFLVEGKPNQKINKEFNFKMEYLESYFEYSNEEISKLIKPHDLSQAPLLRVILIKYAQDRHLLIVDMHHLIADGVSSFILLNELILLYNNHKLPHLKYQYKDFLQWRKNIDYLENLKKQEEYWLNIFSGNLPVLNIATDFERKSIQDFDGNDIYFNINEDLCKKLEINIADTGTTLYMYLLTVCYILLSKYSKQEDIIIGTPVAGRNNADLENIVGTLFRQLAIRNYPTINKTFKEFLIETKHNVFEVFQNQDYQFNDLINRLRLKWDLNRHPLYDVVFAIEDRFSTISINDSLALTPCKYSNNTSKTDLRFGIIEDNGEIIIKLTYCTGLFKYDTCYRMGEHFVEILDQVLNNEDIKIENITISHRLRYSESESTSEYESDFDY